MSGVNDRIKREKKTMRMMIGIYCRGHHGRVRQLCADCGQLLDYADQCIDRCPFREDKPVCGKCPVHCYKPDMRERIRRVMRYAGPRMLIYHPVLAVLHHIDGLKALPCKGGKAG
jgi:predicted amidophosphoribosyltransferase